MEFFRRLPFLNSFALKAALLMSAGLVAGCGSQLSADGAVNGVGHGAGIFGGQKISQDSVIASWVVALTFDDEAGNSRSCTASWIADRWLITAAHCIPTRLESLRLHQGVHVSYPSRKESNSLSVKQVIVHPNFATEAALLKRDKNWEQANVFDLALIEVKGTWLPHGRFDIDSPSSNSTGATPSNGSWKTAGYGVENYDLLEDAKTEDLNLRMAELSSPSTGKAKASNTGGVFKVDQRGDQGICLGDSGAPLFAESEKGVPILYAVASSVRNPGSSLVCHGESRFVSLAGHVDWIRGSTASSEKN